MSEYIDREAVLAEIEWHKNEFCECEYAFKSLENNLPLPAADVAPVVHCAECIHRKKDFVGDGYICGIMHGAFTVGVIKPGDYCSRGERARTND